MLILVFTNQKDTQEPISLQKAACIAAHFFESDSITKGLKRIIDSHMLFVGLLPEKRVRGKLLLLRDRVLSIMSFKLLKGILMFSYKSIH